MDLLILFIMVTVRMIIIFKQAIRQNAELHSIMLVVMTIMKTTRVIKQQKAQNLVFTKFIMTINYSVMVMTIIY